MSRPFLSESRRATAPRRVLRSWTIALMCGVLVAGCSGEQFGREHHVDMKGPLSATSGEGGFAALAVKSGTRYHSFGDYRLCAYEEGVEIKLERVAYKAKVKPIEVEFGLRTVKAEDIIMNGDEVASEYSAFISTKGRPPDYAGADTQYAGTHTRDIAGTKITQPCGEMGLTDGFTVLIMTMKVDKGGARIPGMTIEYTANDKRYALDTRWEMIACGAAVVDAGDDEYCSESE